MSPLGSRRVPSPVGGSDARRAAQAELRRREYHHEPSLISRILHWITDHLGRAVDSVSSGGSTTAHALLVVLVVVLAAAIVFAVRAGVPHRRRRRATAETSDLLAPDSTQDHRRLALRFAAEGRRAEALREWLRAAVATIEDRGVLPPRPGRTGAATAREAGPVLAAAAADLTAAVTAFDEVWFGGRGATDTDVARGQAAADGVAAARIRGADPVAAADGLAVPW